MSSDNNKYNHDYDKGYSEGKKGDYYADLEHSNSTRNSDESSDNSHSYDSGYADGIKDRYNWREKEKGKDGCFITTACVEHKGLGDNAAELSILRNFRDSYIRNLPDGEKLIQLYYNNSPQIVNAISRLESEQRRLELDNIYDKIKLACSLIISGKLKEAFALYCDTVILLDKKYSE